MGEDLSLKGRDAVRTAMQWNHEPGGGFSAAPPETFARPIVSGGPVGYEQLNVEDQERDRESMLGRIEQMIRARKHCPHFGWGRCRVVPTNQPGTFAHAVTWEGQMVLAVHNLADREMEVRLDWGEEKPDRLTTLISDGADGEVDVGPETVRMSPYGYRWFRAQLA